MKSGKIAFVKMGVFSLVNARVISVLSQAFPNFEIDVIDVERDLVSQTNLANILFALKEYSLDILLGRRKLSEEIASREILARTPFFFQAVKSAVERRLAGRNYTFSFQTQSLFDASIAELPHFVYTDHTHLANLRYPHFEYRQLYADSWIELEKTIYKNATGIFTTSNFVAQSVLEDYDCEPQKVFCVYSGVNLDVQSVKVPHTYSGKNILFVGKDWRRKGGPQLVEAFTKVLKVFPEAHLTIVGCLPRIAVPNCEVVGFVPVERVGEYYERASVFCLPSRVEPSAVVLAEAAAHYLPIVSTDIGGTPDRVIHGETGYLVAAGDVDQLSEALIALLGDSAKCAEFGKRGQALSSERFRWDRVGERIRAHVENTLANM